MTVGIVPEMRLLFTEREVGILARAAVRYRCCVCGAPGQAVEATNVVAVVDGGEVQVALAHELCHEPAVLFEAG